MSHPESEKRIYRGNRTEIWLVGLPESPRVEKRLLPFADVSPQRTALFHEALMQRRAGGPGVIPVDAPALDQLALEELRHLNRAYIPGLTLRERRQTGPCSVQETAAILKPIMNTLARLHAPQAGSIIHRDITPGNIILDQHGHPWLNDFGLARDDTCPRLEDDESLQGTRSYLSPELLAGEQPTTASDIFQSALLACFLLNETSVASPLNPEERQRWAEHWLSPLGLEACVAPQPKERPAAQQVALIWERFLA